MVAHGHTHDASYNDIVGNVKIVNPGPLFKCWYAVYVLKKHEETWIVDSIDFRSF